MLLEVNNFGGGQSGPFCPSCKRPVSDGQKSTRIVFDNDPHGFKGLSGQYHADCGKPFASMAKALKMMSRPHG